MPFDGSNFNSNGNGGGDGESHRYRRFPTIVTHFNVFNPVTNYVINPDQAIKISTYISLINSNNSINYIVDETKYFVGLTENAIYNNFRTLRTYVERPKFIFYYNLGGSVCSEFMIQLALYLRFDIEYRTLPKYFLVAILSDEHFNAMRDRRL